MSETSRSLPLARYTVLDLTIARAGPTAVRLLSDWGARVIRVEPPPLKDRGSVTGRRRGADEQNLHRNKLSVCIDLKTPRGAQILRKLMERSDVLVENFRSAVKDRLGLNYEQVKAINRRIILASISGFGQDGPYSERPGVDQIVQGMSGLMSITGDPAGGPMRAGIAISDTSAGMFLGQGILMALLDREHTGEGQWVHTSLLEAMLNKLDFQAARYTVRGEVPVQEGNSHPTQVPMGTFRASDGLINLAASTQKMWRGFCHALAAESLFNNPNYADMAGRLAHRRELEEEMNRFTQHHTVADLVDRLNKANVPCGPIYNIGEAFEDAQVKHLRMTRPATHPVLGDVQLLRTPINMSAYPHPERFESAAPDPGEQTDALLAELDYDAQSIAALRAEGVVS
jgi:crotonobetainyl-CoA:carnitine CoA-transferase CaiB-like acyl-CoA transferase